MISDYHIPFYLDFELEAFFGMIGVLSLSV